MLKRLRAKHPVGFCVLSEVLFLGSLLLASYLIVFALVLFGVDLERVDSYFLSAVQEAVGMVVALLILGRTGAAAFSMGCWWECIRWCSLVTACIPS